MDHQIRQRFLDTLGRLPEAEALDVMGQHLKLMVRGKCFGWVMTDHHGNGRLEFNCKAAPGVQLALVQQDPVHYYVPAYCGHRGWVGVWLDVPEVPWNEVADLVVIAYCLSAPKRLAAEITR